MSRSNIREKWYVGGLHFGCMGCGNCCAGPEEGYIWITRAEIEMLAEHLGVTVEEVRQKYITRVGSRTSIVEDPQSKDCIFLSGCGANRGCAIYAVRPNQCRTWPFWTGNLTSCHAWNEAALRCPGINRGSLYTFDEIERIRKQNRWWDEDGG